MEKIAYEVMVTGPLANAKILSGYFGYYKTIANNYILGKEKLAAKSVRAANRYLQFYRIWVIFGSVKSWSLNTHTVLKKIGNIFCLKSFSLKNGIKDWIASNKGLLLTLWSSSITI